MFRARFSLFAVLPAVLLWVFACTSRPQQAQSTAKDTTPAWNSRMEAMSHTLSSLMPLVANSKRFSDPANKAKISEHLQSLNGLAHALPKKSEVKPPDADPTLQFIGEAFDEELKRAQEAWQLGHLEYTRQLLHNATGYCIRCHTRNASGPDEPSFRLKLDFTGMDEADKAELLTATRQFDDALESYKKVIANPYEAQKQPFQWEKSARQALALAVRAKQSPEEGLQIAERILQQPAVPEFMRKDAQQWKRDLVVWMKKPQKKPSGDKEKLKEAKDLIQQAQKQMEFPTDGGTDVLWLRASADLHDLLSHPQKAQERADLLFLLGQSYEALRDMDQFSLHETYYEACIRQTPHSDQAQRCYKRLESSIHQGYSGSRGLSLPESVGRHLQKLKLLASAESKTGG